MPRHQAAPVCSNRSGRQTSKRSASSKEVAKGTKLAHQNQDGENMFEGYEMYLQVARQYTGHEQWRVRTRKVLGGKGAACYWRALMEIIDASEHESTLKLFQRVDVKGGVTPTEAGLYCATVNVYVYNPLTGKVDLFHKAEKETRRGVLHVLVDNKSDWRPHWIPVKNVKDTILPLTREALETIKQHVDSKSYRDMVDARIAELYPPPQEESRGPVGMNEVALRVAEDRFRERILREYQLELEEMSKEEEWYRPFTPIKFGVGNNGVPTVERVAEEPQPGGVGNGEEEVTETEDSDHSDTESEASQPSTTPPAVEAPVERGCWSALKLLFGVGEKVKTRDRLKYRTAYGANPPPNVVATQPPLWCKMGEAAATHCLSVDIEDRPTGVSGLWHKVKHVVCNRTICEAYECREEILIGAEVAIGDLVYFVDAPEDPLEESRTVDGQLQPGSIDCLVTDGCNLQLEHQRFEVQGDRTYQLLRVAVREIDVDRRFLRALGKRRFKVRELAMNKPLAMDLEDALDSLPSDMARMRAEYNMYKQRCDDEVIGIMMDTRNDHASLPQVGSVKVSSVVKELSRLNKAIKGSIPGGARPFSHK